ncbi:MAG TPA: mechanosensitive ion channel domain-containing protein [Gemmata sp.]
MLRIRVSRGLVLVLCCTVWQAQVGTRTLAREQPATVSPPAPDPKTPPTDAEKITDARESIKQATAALEKLQKRLTDPDSEYAKAEGEFEALNGKLKTLKTTAAKLRKEGKVTEAVALEVPLPGLQEDWQLAKDRFDIAIRQKKVTQETIAGLKERIESERHLLAQLEGKAQPAEPPAGPPNPKTPKPPEPVPAPPKDEPKAPADPVPPITLPGIPGAPPLPAAPITPTAPAAAAEDNDPAVRQARAQLGTRRDELREAEARARAAEERVRVMERATQNAEKMLGLDKEAVAQAEKAVAKLAGARPPEDETERSAQALKLMETESRLAESRERVRRTTDRIARFNETLAGLRAERDVLAREVQEKQQQVNEAETALNELLSPTAPRNLFRWALAKGPRVLLILVGMVVAHLVTRQFSHHIVRFITRNSNRGSPEDRENRASTLVGVFRYAVGLVIFGGGAVMVLDEIGVPIVPLMGGAAVIGLAVAFGAQNLIRDYFTGFMMLMEDQYSVNDVVKIGAIAGLVEQITLRMTVLRDLEGVRHFIPHGTVTSVSNLTHGWSRAMIDVPVAYKESVNRVTDVLVQLGRELRLDPVLGRHILEDPEMLGVEALSDTGVVIRFLLKTRPLQQWPVKREMLRRIKNRFDELGIEIAFPHRTLYHRFPDGGDASALTGGSDRSAA